MVETLFRYNILVIGQGSGIAEIEQLRLDKERYRLCYAPSGRDGLQLFRQLDPDIIFINLHLPDTDGIILCREIREQPVSNFPFVFILSEQDAAYCEIEAFRSGADDYIKIPVQPEILKMRLEAFLKRIARTTLLGSSDVVSIGNLRIDTHSQIVYLDDKLLYFPKKEVEVLALLAKNPEKVFTREQIIQTVWKNEMLNSSMTVDVRIHNIRQKIGEARIKTIKHLGYKFVTDTRLAK